MHVMLMGKIMPLIGRYLAEPEPEEPLDAVARRNQEKLYRTLAQEIATLGGLVNSRYGAELLE